MLPDTSSVAIVRPLLTSSLPDLSVKKLRLLMSGDEFDTWEVDGAVVKFPKSAEDAVKLDREVAIAG